MSFSITQAGSFLATGVYNLDSSRFRAAPLDKRTEGWTEAWGATDLGADASFWKLDDESVSMLLATPHPQLPLVLTQFRPAWFEQLVLRMARIPHIVINSAYISSEATGPLPYLRDQQQSKPPVLVGRHHPSNIAPVNVPCNNSILDYLKSNRTVDLDANLTDDQERSLSKCFLNLIQSELENILLYLRYEDDDAWEQVYRRQYLNASSPHSDNWISHLKGRFQASMERAASRRRLVESSRTMTVKLAVERAKEAYQALEHQLDGKTFLMGNGDKPSLVDAVLWAHVADALCDVHLVVLLASFPKLVKHFQHIYKTYFTGNVDKWDEWNQQQNMTNAFQQLPIDGKNIQLAKTGFKDAIDLMQSLSLRKQDLQDVLDAAKAKRVGELWPVRAPPTESLLYRWRMGEDLTKKPLDTPEPAEENPMRKKLLRDQTRNDQVWISGVAGVSAVAILLLQGASKDSQ
jgi:glutathione S-transferase